jgi:uncharacterized RDD family membrane protein YckC
MSDSLTQSASLWRRLAAMVYDGLLIFAVLVVVGASTLPLTSGLGVSRDNIFFKFYVFGALFLFLGWFWTHGGQTLGMRAWKIKLVRADGTPVTWQLAFFYYLVSLPMWVFLIFAIARNAGMLQATGFFGGLAHWVLYSLALIWFVIDHLPNNWRQKVAGLRMVQVK